MVNEKPKVSVIILIYNSDHKAISKTICKVWFRLPVRTEKKGNNT